MMPVPSSQWRLHQGMQFPVDANGAQLSPESCARIQQDGYQTPEAAVCKSYDRSVSPRRSSRSPAPYLRPELQQSVDAATRDALQLEQAFGPGFVEQAAHAQSPVPRPETKHVLHRAAQEVDGRQGVHNLSSPLTQAKVDEVKPDVIEQNGSVNELMRTYDIGDGTDVEVSQPTPDTAERDKIHAKAVSLRQRGASVPLGGCTASEVGTPSCNRSTAPSEPTGVRRDIAKPQQQQRKAQQAFRVRSRGPGNTSRATRVRSVLPGETAGA